MDCVTTYPFYIMGGDWGSAIAPVKDELPLKGDTIVGNDVWIGQNVTVMPGVHITLKRRIRSLFRTRILLSMCLPAGPYVSDDDVKYIVETIKHAIA